MRRNLEPTATDRKQAPLIHHPSTAIFTPLDPIRDDEKMKRFAFRLQTLLDHRENIEQQCGEELGRLHSELATTKNNLHSLDGEIRDAIHQRQQQIHRGELENARLSQDYLHVLAVRRRQHEQRAAALQEEIADAQAAFLAARRDHQAVDALRNRDLEAYRYQRQQDEQKDLDEITTQRFR